MKRSIIVGIGAALFGFALVSVSTYLELRYSPIGSFIRDWSTQGSPGSRHGDPLDFMLKWWRFQQFIVSPAIAILVGLFVGSLSRRHFLLPLLVAVTPIILIDCRLWDALSILSIIACMLAGWGGVMAAQMFDKRRIPLEQSA